MKKTAPKKKIYKAKIRWGIPLIFGVVILVALLISLIQRNKSSVTTTNLSNPTASVSASLISLPAPDTRSGNSVEAMLKTRRTKRNIIDTQLTLKQVSQVLWSAQGVTTDWGGRTAPSAKSIYPLTVYLISNNISGLEKGEYKYIPGDRDPVHALEPVLLGDLQNIIFEGVNQGSLKNAPAVLIITGDMDKMATAYGGIKHDKDVYLEAGHAGQNIYLQAESQKLGVVAITSFHENKLRENILIPENETVIYLIPYGVPKL